eukprot:Nitzschia sp. Nitz4//scaffold1_size375055//99440//101442//NITZ4_000238-RA/size375055-augustus-gene-0.710-mRNA-1//-1//CDS//3329540931//7535//frame0
MNYTCEIPNVELIEEYNATEFYNTRAIEWMHSVSPRFGHSKNILSLMEGSDTQQKDYMRGLMASSLAMFCFFGVWMIVLLVFRCMGPYEVGFLSGRMRPLPPKPSSRKNSNSNSRNNGSWNRIDASGSVSSSGSASERWFGVAVSADDVNWEQMRRNKERWLKFLRSCVCFFGLAIIVSSLLMAKNGVKSLTSSLDDSRGSLSIADALADRAIELIDLVAEQNIETGAAVELLLEDINMMCPNLRPDGLCTDLTDPSTCDFDDILDDSVMISTIKHFQEADESIYYQELISGRADLVQFKDLVKDVDDSAVQFNWALFAAVVGSLTLAGLCLVIVTGVLLRSWTALNCIRNWLVVPTFSVLVVLSFIFSMLFVVGSMVVADLCVDSPDSRILVILDRFRDELSSIAVEIASFYINDCPADAIPQELAVQIEFVLNTIPTLGDFSDMVKQSATELQELCGFEDPTSLALVADVANQQLCEIVDILDQIRLFFQCENWFPLYESTMYNAVCYDGTDGFAWVAVTQFVIVFFSALLLTFRAAFYDVEIEGEGENEALDSGSMGKADPDDRSITLPPTPPPVSSRRHHVNNGDTNEFEVTFS